MDHISYEPLFTLLRTRCIPITRFRVMTGLSPSTITKLNRNEYVSMEVLVRICRALQCRLSDIVTVDIS